MIPLSNQHVAVDEREKLLSSHAIVQLSCGCGKRKKHKIVAKKDLTVESNQIGYFIRHDVGH